MNATPIKPIHFGEDQFCIDGGGLGAIGGDDGFIRQEGFGGY